MTFRERYIRHAQDRFVAIGPESAARDIIGARRGAVLAAGVGIAGAVGTAMGVHIDVSHGNVVAWAMVVGGVGTPAMISQARTNAIAFRRAFPSISMKSLRRLAVQGE
jgi:hypothetical protein